MSEEWAKCWFFTPFYVSLILIKVEEGMFFAISD